MTTDHVSRISAELHLKPGQVERTLKLLSEGATVPFIARYRKELTGLLDETAIISIRDRANQLAELDKRRETVIETIRGQDKLTDELEQQISRAATMTELEDIYLPYRPKRKTRASVAQARGLEPLAKIIMAQKPGDIEVRAADFVDAGREVNTPEEALEGARDIIAGWINESLLARNRMRDLFFRKASLTSRVIRGKEQEGQVYRDWFEWQEPAMKAPSHRVLAMFRGENEGILRISVEPDREEAIGLLERIFVKTNDPASGQVAMAARDGYLRLLQPAMETEIRAVIKEKADAYAIGVFADNVRQLLLAPPLGQKNVMAIDPGFRTGCKVVCLDRQGGLLHNETIFPHPPVKETGKAIAKIQALVKSYKIEAIAIGNGTAGRETEDFIRRIRFEQDIIAVMVNESGASVYSASDIARREFPDYDITVRGAVSIGRRLMDPLAELVKIDPKAIGVGQYQHDVDQKALGACLNDTVTSCVNLTGVELNTASRELLTYVSGIGPSLAQGITAYREKTGPFRSREELKKVPRFGEKAFEQAAGFLRIRNGKHPLDNTAVHPESYAVVEGMAMKLDCTAADLIGSEELRKKIRLEDFITEKTGLPTLTDIMEELSRPGRDPREKYGIFEFHKGISSIEDLREGMVLPGIITNITAFGAFVDIGIHQSGLIHVSQISDRFVKDPGEVVRLNQKVKVRVVSVDPDRKRIQLSLRDVDTKS
jgi:uncharacterized protein